MHVRLNYDNVSFEKGESPQKIDRLWGGGMVIRNGGSKNSTSPPYLVKNERSLKRLEEDISKTYS